MSTAPRPVHSTLSPLASTPGSQTPVAGASARTARDTLNTLLNSQRHRIWRGRQGRVRANRPDTGPNDSNGLRSGFPELDQALPDAGWPRGGLVELLHEHPGQGELSLLLPLLARLTRQKRPVLMVQPPFLPCTSALQAAGIHLPCLHIIQSQRFEAQLWCCVQALRSTQCAALLAWPEQGTAQISTTQLRRLQLAAEQGQTTAFLYRRAGTRTQASPAALRIALQSLNDIDNRNGTALHLDIFKCRGQFFTRPLRLFPYSPPSVQAGS